MPASVIPPPPTLGFPDCLIFQSTNTDAFDFLNLWSFLLLYLFLPYRKEAVWERDLDPSLLCGHLGVLALAPSGSGRGWSMVRAFLFTNTQLRGLRLLLEPQLWGLGLEPQCCLLNAPLGPSAPLGLSASCFCVTSTFVLISSHTDWTSLPAMLVERKPFPPGPKGTPRCATCWTSHDGWRLSLRRLSYSSTDYVKQV